MRKAAHTDKGRIVDILAKSFNDNRSVNYIIKQDGKRSLRIKRLMEYSFGLCKMFGDVFITEDNSGCALVLMPDKKKLTLASILLDTRFAISCLGIPGLKKAMKRETAIKAQHPKGKLYYLWFIGVDPTKQQRGTGTSLLKEVIHEGQKDNRTICLETSTLKNIPWYQSLGFTIYHEFDFGYKLFCLKMRK